MKDLSKEGIVKNINNNEITVEIQSCSACSSCMIKNYCSTSESKQKEITIKNEDAHKYKTGEAVLITIDTKQAVKSIILAYVIPLILVVSTIVGMTAYNKNEIIAGICGIIILIPYYFGLFLAKNKLKSDFEFKISKKDANKNG